jgi:hypothetical protein
VAKILPGKMKCDFPGCEDGLVKHPKRLFAGEIPDPQDYQAQETCSKCGGSGQIKLVIVNLPEQSKNGSDPKPS